MTPSAFLCFRSGTSALWILCKWNQCAVPSSGTVVLYFNDNFIDPDYQVSTAFVCHQQHQFMCCRDRKGLYVSICLDQVVNNYHNNFLLYQARGIRSSTSIYNA